MRNQLIINFIKLFQVYPVAKSILLYHYKSSEL